MSLWRRTLDLLFPPRCPFCGRILEKQGICGACRKSLPWIEGEVSRELRTGLPCAASLWYEGEVRKGLLRFKFHGGRSAAEPLGELLAQCAAEAFPGEFDLVTWVPVSRRRLRHRGYDQAQLLAEAACRMWDTRPVRLLNKITDNPAQSGLSDESARRANVLGVYDPVHGEQIRGSRILLVDDICTTGATLGECAGVLEAAGAEKVVCACVARTPKKGDKRVACGGNIQENRIKSR